MRKSGNITKKLCWNLIISIDGNIIKEQKYRTLKDISNELNLSYNIVSEMAMGRKKNKSGTFEPQYSFKRLS